jgi:hypothetical protein
MRVLLAALGLLAGLTGAARAIEPVSEADVAAAIRFHFGQTAAVANMTSLTGDVTCDGVDDAVLTYFNPDNPDGPLLHVMIVTHAAPAMDDGTAGSVVVDLPFSNDMQFAVCGAPQATAVALEEWTEEDLAETFALPVCRVAMRVEDPECDRPRLFWITGESDEGRIAFFRN